MVRCDRCEEATNNEVDPVTDEVLCIMCLGSETGDVIDDEGDEPGSLLDNPLNYKGWNPLSNEW